MPGTWNRPAAGAAAFRARHPVHGSPRDLRRQGAGTTVDEIGEAEAGELAPRVAEGADECVIRELDPAIGTRNQNEIAGVLGRRREQPHPSVGALQFASLRGKTKRQDAEASHRH